MLRMLILPFWLTLCGWVGGGIIGMRSNVRGVMILMSSCALGTFLALTLRGYALLWFPIPACVRLLWVVFSLRLVFNMMVIGCSRIDAFGVVVSWVPEITLLGITLIARVCYPCLGILFRLVLAGLFRVVICTLRIDWVKWLKRFGLFIMVGNPAQKALLVFLFAALLWGIASCLVGQ